MRKRIFGFDLGIASIGWAVVDFDKENFDTETGELIEGKIVGAGVRCFPVAENPKDGASLAAPRRESRLARRTCKRKARRMHAIKSLFISYGLISDFNTLDALYAQQTGGDVWNLRIKALKEQLTKEELIRVLTHLAKHRGFKSYRKAVEEQDAEGGKVLKAIKENKDCISENKTLAQIIVERSGTTGKKRNSTKKNEKGKDVAIYNNSIPRDEIERETDLIFTAQKQYGIFTDKLYEDFKKIAFRFRPTGSIAAMVGDCTFEKGEKRAPKEAPSSELFVALSKLNHMLVKDNASECYRPLRLEEKDKIIELLKKTKVVKYSTLASKIFTKNVIFKEVDYSKTEKKAKDGSIKKIDPLDTIFYQMKGWHKLKAQFTPEELTNLQQNIPLLDAAVNVIACEKNDKAIRAGLQKLNIEEKYIEKLLNCTFDKFLNLSFKALYKIIPAMHKDARTQEEAKNLTYIKVCDNIYPNQNKKGQHVQDGNPYLMPLSSQEQTTVPVVNRTLAQFRKVYNAIVRQYGSPDQINIETGRDLKKTHEERMSLKSLMEEREEERRNDIDELKEKKCEPNAANVLKLRLYKEQDGKSMYSGKRIDIDQLLTNTKYAEVDHIIPYSRSLDNSYNNKALCLSDENQAKGNKTPFEYIKDPEKWREFEARVNLLKNRKKADRLLDTTFKDREQEFKDRNSNDNSHIARCVKKYCEQNIDFSKSPCTTVKNRVQVRTGHITAYLRRQWGLEKDRNESDRHHAQDAIVLACATQEMVSYLSYVSSIFENKYEVQAKTGEAWYYSLKQRYQEPWNGFRNEVLQTIDNIFVSRPPRKKATGSAHKDTIYPKEQKKGTLPVRGGMAEKDNMFRIDIFKKDHHYYAVPIYTVDLVSKKNFEDAPQPYITLNIDGQETHARIDDSYQFIFSLYKDDYICVSTDEGSVSGYFNQYSAQKGQFYIGSMDNAAIYQIGTSTFTIEDKILLPDGKIGKVTGFNEASQKMIVTSKNTEIEINAEVKKNKKGEITENFKTSQAYTKLANEKKVAITVITDFKKYQVDLLGNINEVKKETRAKIFNIKSEKQKHIDRELRLKAKEVTNGLENTSNYKTV